MEETLKQYNIAWDCQSADCSESMPCGGHDVGMNVWVENDEVPVDAAWCTLQRVCSGR